MLGLQSLPLTPPPVPLVEKAYIPSVPPIIWRGVAARPRPSSKFVHGIGEVPKRYFDKSLSNIKAEEQTAPSEERIRIGAVERQLAVTSAFDDVKGRFMSCSRSWLYALTWALCDTLLFHKMQDVEGLKRVLQDARLLGILPSKLHNRQCLDLSALMRSSAPREYLMKHPEILSANTFLPTTNPVQSVNVLIDAADTEQEIAVFGRLPPGSFFSLSCFDLIKPGGLLERLGVPSTLWLEHIKGDMTGHRMMPDIRRAICEHFRPPHLSSITRVTPAQSQNVSVAFAIAVLASNQAGPLSEQDQSNLQSQISRMMQIWLQEGHNDVRVKAARMERWRRPLAGEICWSIAQTQRKP